MNTENNSINQSMKPTTYANHNTQPIQLRTCVKFMDRVIYKSTIRHRSKQKQSMTLPMTTQLTEAVKQARMRKKVEYLCRRALSRCPQLISTDPTTIVISISNL